jgi:hypothetical protein
LHKVHTWDVLAKLNLRWRRYCHPGYNKYPPSMLGHWEWVVHCLNIG